MAFNNWCAHFFDVLSSFSSTYHYAIAFISISLGIAAFIFMIFTLFWWVLHD